MKNADLKERSKQFAHACVKLSLIFPKSQLGYHLQKQLIRCSTSVAANYRASCLAQSRSSFISKLSIVIEEADECAFWLEFIRDEKLITSEDMSEILKEARELSSIFCASRITARKNLNK